jgi:hypothetical protein
MKNNKATSYDEIPAEFWKIFCTMRGRTEILTNMLNKIRNGKEFPLDRKTATIHPIYKGKGNREKPGNYEHLHWCFVDFEKAFDSIHREALWYKLRRA